MMWRIKDWVLGDNLKILSRIFKTPSSTDCQLYVSKKTYEEIVGHIEEGLVIKQVQIEQNELLKARHNWNKQV